MVRGGVARPVAGLLLALALCACSATGRVAGTVVVGSACPAASAEPSPACSPEPLAGVALTIVRESSESSELVDGTPASASGTTVAQPTTDSAGSFSVQLDPGRYYVYGDGVYGLKAPRPVFFDVSAAATTSVILAFGAVAP